MYAARKTWAFDGIYWKFLDEGFFGTNEGGGYKPRLGPLSRSQVEDMEVLVERKVREKEERSFG